MVEDAGVEEVISKFQAILAESTSMLKVSNEGVCKITFETDETQLPNVLGVLLGKDQLLTVTVSKA